MRHPLQGSLRRLGWLGRLSLLLASMALGQAQAAVGIANPAGQKGSQDQEPMIEILSRSPRDFGFTLGDLVEQQFQVTLPPGERLNLNTLPSPGKLTDWLDLRAFYLETPTEGETSRTDTANMPRRYQLHFKYQLFKQVDQTSTIKLPPTTVLLESGKKLILPVWPLTYGRLLPANYERTQVLAQPRPPALPTTAMAERWRFGLLITLGIVSLVWLWLTNHLPLLKAPRGHFARTYRAIRRLPANEASHTSAITLFQRALAHDAGETLFPDNLTTYFAAKPHYQPLQEQTVALLQRNHQARFDPKQQHAALQNRDDVLALCKHFSQLEQRQWKR